MPVYFYEGVFKLRAFLTSLSGCWMLMCVAWVFAGRQGDERVHITDELVRDIQVSVSEEFLRRRSERCDDAVTNGDGGRGGDIDFYGYSQDAQVGLSWKSIGGRHGEDGPDGDNGKPGEVTPQMVARSEVELHFSDANLGGWTIID